MTSLVQQKYQCLLRLGLTFHKGLNEFEVGCELCGRPLKGDLVISKNDRVYSIRVVAANFHHDPEEVLLLYCRECHKRIHDWGLIQRWLKKIGKNPEDLPDATKLRPMRRH